MVIQAVVDEGDGMLSGLHYSRIVYKRLKICSNTLSHQKCEYIS